MKRRRGKIAAGVAGVVLAVLLGVYWQEIAGWVKFVYLFESIGRNEQRYPEYRHRETGIVFVRVPGGRFLMGTREEDKDEAIEEYLRVYGENGRKKAEQVAAAEFPQHEVTLSPFLIAKHEVSQTQWRHVMRSTNSRFEGPNLPMDNLSWNDCRDFCRLPDNAQGYAEYRHMQTGLVFVRLPGGEFFMGTSEDDGERLVEELSRDSADPDGWKRSIASTRLNSATRA